MSDMLVRLYAVDDVPSVPGVTVRRPMMPEQHTVLEWIGERFSRRWVSEAQGAFALRPIACIIALRDTEILGFGVYDSTALGVMGPFGVSEAARGSGIGRAICLAVAHEMRSRGYQYAVIGSVGPKAFYERTLGATEIADSDPGMYRGMIR
jgi:ribosomal protein S18 acetylase RimI-like enzyme